MRLLTCTLLISLPVCAFAQNTRVESSDSESRIVVVATKSARVTPDRATMYITVEGTGESTTDAAQRASQKLQAVTTALRTLVASDGITPVPYGVGPASNRNSFPGVGNQSSFVSRYMIRVQPRNLEQLTQVAAAAIAAGATNTSAPMFESQAADSVRRAKYAEALAQARRDAEALASALGGKLGSIVDVSTTGTPQSFTQQSMLYMSGFEYSGPSPAPDVTVNATVTVRFRFIAQ